VALGDKYVATLSSHWFDDIDNPFDNVFAYEGGAGAPTAADLASAIGVSLVSVLVPVTSSGVTYDSVTVINLDDPTDFAVQPVGVTGTVSGDCMPKFVAWAFIYFRGTRAVANGRKSFPGVPESQVQNGAPASGVDALLDDVAEFLSLDIEGVSPTNSYIPRIWRRAGTYEGGTFPDTFYPVQSVGFRRVSTQNTRKR